MEAKYVFFVTVAALLASIHQGDALECLSCSTYMKGTGVNGTGSSIDHSICLSAAEIGGPVQGAKVITCNNDAEHKENACYKAYTYAFSPRTKERIVTMFSRGCAHAEEPDSCTHHDGYTAKTDHCFCTTNKCNGAQGLSFTAMPLLALLCSALFLVSRH